MYFSVRHSRTEIINVDMLHPSNNSQMTGGQENASLLCGKDPAYYTSTIGTVVDWLIFFVGLPEVCLACYALLRLLKKDKAAPIFAINLLLSDLLQIGITLIFIISRFFHDAYQPMVRARCISRLFVRLGLTSNLGFMLLISAERYLMIAYPLWYHTTNVPRLAVLTSLGMWTLSLAYSCLDYIVLISTAYSLLVFSIICLLPAPFLVAFFTATWISLNKSVAMRHETENRRRVLRVLSLVLGTYIVLFIPFSLRNFHYSLQGDSAADTEDTVKELSGVITSAMVYLNPLVDALVYIFMRRDIRDTVEAFPCCKIPLMKLKRFQDGPTESSQTATALELTK